MERPGDLVDDAARGITSPRDRVLNGTEQSCILRDMPRPDLLETFPNPYPDRPYEIAMECPEFTSLCPLGGIETDAAELRQLEGGAPDFATIHIRYVPAAVCVELKSLKLYLWSFRNDGIFYERAVNRILDDLATSVQPAWMEVVGDFNIRGGIKSVITARVGARTSDA
jgi:7-cyano-7-deazaguanine reductase